MKNFGISAVATAVALYSIGAGAVECSFCADGLEVDAETVLPSGETCRKAVDTAKMFGAESIPCDGAKIAAVLSCCPSQVVPAEDPCPVCPEGLEAADDTLLPSSNDDEVTCNEALTIFGMLEVASPFCASSKTAIEVTCCLSQAPPTCDFCPGGLAVAASTNVPMPEGNTCGSLASSAVAIAPDNKLCAEIQQAQVLCCPAGNGGASPDADASTEAEATTDVSTDESTDESPDVSTDASTDATVAAPTGVPPDPDAEDAQVSVPDAEVLGDPVLVVSVPVNGAAAAGWVEASVPTVAVVILVLFA